jgi:hypothetical protein
MSGLVYIGNGAAIIGIPARDLTEEEIKALPQEFDIEKLIASGLYARPGAFDKQDAEKVLPHVLKKTKKEGES